MKIELPDVPGYEFEAYRKAKPGEIVFADGTAQVADDVDTQCPQIILRRKLKLKVKRWYVTENGRPVRIDRSKGGHEIFVAEFPFNQSIEFRPDGKQALSNRGIWYAK